MKKTGDSYLDSEDFRAMLEDYEMMVEAGQPIFMDADDLTDIAEYYNCIGEQKKCADVIDYARSIAPDAASPIEFLAHKAINEGNLERAQQLIDMVDDDDDPEYQCLKAEMCLVNGNFDESVEVIDEYYSTLDEECQNDFCYDVVNLYIRYNYFKTAKGWFDMIEKEDSVDYLDLQCRLAYLLDNFELCISTANKLLEQEPFTGKYWILLAQSQLACGYVLESLNSSAFALAIDPNDINTLLARAMGYKENNNNVEALKYFKRALSLNPNASEVLLQLSSFYVDNDDLMAALPYAQRAVEASREDEEMNIGAYKSLILILASLKRPKEALLKVEEAERQEFEDFESEIFRGYIYLTCDNLREAHAAFKRAFCRSKDIVHTTLLVIMALEDNGYYDLAYELGNDFMKGDDGSNYFDHGCAYMTMICLRLNKDEEAVAYFRKAAKRAPTLMASLMSSLTPAELNREEYHDFLKNKAKK